MTKLAMIALAASAAWIPGTLAAQTVADPGFDGVTSVALALPMAMQAAAPPPRSGHGAHHMPPPRTGPPVMHNPPGRGMRHHPGMPGHGQTRRFIHINRGGMLPGFWFGPQFHVRNWGLYGFPQPFDGGRWVRYYDDALLIDRDGRVHDRRGGMDWDRYGERWHRGDDGVPLYGDGDWDEDWDEDWDDRGDRRGHHGDRRHQRERCVQRCDDYSRHGPPMPAPQGYGYGGHGSGYGYGGYGYGYGWGPILVTETVVTTAPVVEMRTYYETVTERVRVKPRAVRRCKCARPAPRPRPGERG